MTNEYEPQLPYDWRKPRAEKAAKLKEERAKFIALPAEQQQQQAKRKCGGCSRNKR